MLAVDNLTSGYGRIEVLHGVSLEVAAGEIVALVGSNGAGKTTLMRTISGVHPARSGAIRLAGEAIQTLAPHRRVARGIAQVPEGRQVFAPLSVDDNLRLIRFGKRTRIAEIGGGLCGALHTSDKDYIETRTVVPDPG